MNSRPIAQVAREIGVNEGTLGNWVATYRREHADEEPALELNERARLREAERLGLVLEGSRSLVRAFPSWFARYQFADVAPVLRERRRAVAAR